MFGGFYRQWSHGARLSVPEQISQIELFCEQIDRANSSTLCKLIITGDANLCAINWQDDNYNRKSVH